MKSDKAAKAHDTAHKKALAEANKAIRGGRHPDPQVRSKTDALRQSPPRR
jgi:hypothetical protein